MITVATLSLQKRIFISVGLFVSITLVVVWYVIRPKYEQSVINERTTIVQQIQQYALQTSEEKIQSWVNITRYLAHEAQTHPNELDIAMRQNIALSPSIIQIVITSPPLNDTLTVTNTDYLGFTFLLSDDEWKMHKHDSTTLVQMVYDSLRTMVIVAVKKEFILASKHFFITTFANANEMSESFTKLPIEGRYGSIVRSQQKIIVHNTADFDQIAWEAYPNITSLRTTDAYGKQYIVIASEFSTIPYSSIIVIPASLFLQPVERLFTYSLLFLAGVMVVVMLLGWYVSHQISKPVEQLVHEVEQLSSLDFSKPISAIHLPELSKIGTTIEAMRLILERYQRMNVEKIIFEEWKNKFFLSHSQDMIALTNPDGTFSFMNDAFARLRSELAYTAPVVKRDDLRRHPNISSSKESVRTEQSGTFTVTIHQQELFVKQTHGNHQYLRLHDVSIMKGDEHLGSLLTLHDLTTDRLIEQTKTEMMNVIVHELRTPLNSIIGYASFILEEALTEEEKKEYTTIILESGNHMNTLVNRFLDVQRLESHTVDYPKEQCDLVDIARSVCDSLQPQLTQKKLTLNFSAETNLPTVFAVKDLMREAFLNLLSNAIKYGDEHRTIEVELKKNNTHLQFIVTDFGYGIAAEDQKKLYTKFYRVTSNPKTVGQVGTGLGLAYVKEIMNYHRGDISLESTPEIGCRFTLSIPILHT
ncbi:MAG: PAS domain-containing sensor histidine kinase [Bacteroidota bacterium]